jgi:hypothetical protein
MFKFVCASLALAFYGHLAVATAFTAKTGVVLHQNEPWVVNLYNGGLFYVGRTRSNDAEKNKIEIYNPDLSQKVGEVAVNHGVSYIQANGANQVIVLGRTAEARAYYTTITRQGTGFASQTKSLGMLLPEYFAVSSRGLFFNEAGDAAIYQWQGSAGRKVAEEVSGPGKVVIVGNSLFAIERRSFRPGDENLIKVDLGTSAVTRTFPTLRNNLSNLIYVPSIDRVVVAETFANQLLVVEPTQNRLESTIPVSSPRGLDLWGDHLVVSTDVQKSVAFVNLTSRTVDDTWDLSAVPNLYNTWDLTADAAHGRVYVRSSNVCPTCSVSRNFVVVAEKLEGQLTLSQ